MDLNYNILIYSTSLYVSEQVMYAVILQYACTRLHDVLWCVKLTVCVCACHWWLCDVAMKELVITLESNFPTVRNKYPSLYVGILAEEGFTSSHWPPRFQKLVTGSLRGVWGDSFRGWQLQTSHKLLADSMVEFINASKTTESGPKHTGTCWKHPVFWGGRKWKLHDSFHHQTLLANSALTLRGLLHTRAFVHAMCFYQAA